ncbi:protein adenylyltransferase SelO [Maribacter vaceletii]|nr:YdiU family protein [Maribacter vaceletii]
MKLNLKNTFSKELPADPITENTRRQVPQACFSYVIPKKTAKPMLLHVASSMAQALGISEQEALSKDFLEIFSGNTILPNAKPYAMCYGGHQFGNWAGQLGDGRAINLGEIEHANKRWAVQLKGAGETPYSRTADGLAVLRSSIREYLCSEAMYYLGVPTTRALSLMLTGDKVLRDVLYNGNAAYEKGAVVTRVAPSFIRFGNFEIFSSRNDANTLKKLTDYTIKYFYPHLGEPSKEAYVAFFKEVADKSLEMVLHWQRVGFVHGVMNTDNMSILGLTIDYGPYGWLEGYDLGWTPNTTDRQNKRYRYGNQPQVVQWNLYQLANALYPLIGEADGLEEILHNFSATYDSKEQKMLASKIGVFTNKKGDAKLLHSLQELLQAIETDMTIFYRELAAFNTVAPLKGLEVVKEAFYSLEEFTEELKEKWNLWFTAYAERLEKETLPANERIEKMQKINPKYVLRNYMAQLAIDASDKGDYSILNELFIMLMKPYDEQPEFSKWYAKRPEWARNKVGCSMLSCSS